MRIDSIRLYRVPLAGGPLESLLVAMTSDGQTGWGEATLGAAPRESAEWGSGAFACLRDWLAPAVVGQSISSGPQLEEALASFQDNARAKSALDLAWWNLNAARQSRPLYQTLGGQTETVPLAMALDRRESPEEFLAEIGRAFEAGYDHVILKFRPGWDVEMLRAVRQTFGSEPIAIDCDGLGTLGEQETFYRLEDFFLKYIEQPLAADDLVGHAMLQQALRTPLCLDESITSPARAEQALDLDSCRLAKIELGRVGGLTSALAIGKTFADAGIPCAASAPCAGPLVAQATLALATLPAFSTAVECRMVDFPAGCASGLGLPATRSGRWLCEFSAGTAGGVSLDADKLGHDALETATLQR